MSLDRALQVIEQSLRRVNSHPEYSATVRKEVNASLRDEAARHSVTIESMVRAGTHEKLRPEESTSADLARAWNYLVEHGADLGTLSALGNIVEPKGQSYSGFRRKDVRFGDFSAPVAEVVLSEINNLVYDLQILDVHPLIRAAHAHLELVRIHPYEDGNGRAARLLQNFCLHEKGYPVIIIPSTERGEYIARLNPTLRDRYNHQSSVYSPSAAEGLFYEFLASKLDSSIAFLEEKLKKRRMYDVTITGIKHRPVIYAVAHAIRDKSSRKDGAGAAVRIFPNNPSRNAALLQVVGDIGLHDLNNSVQGIAGRFDLKCAVHVSA